MTPLNKNIKREIVIDGVAYVVTMTPNGVKLTKKGCRLGREISWLSML